MALIRIKRTTVPDLIPTGLTYGEPAVNLADQILYVGGTNDNAIPIGGGGDETTWNNAAPTTATDIDGIPAGTTFDIGLTAIAILERILYPYQEVSFASLNSGLGATVFEMGETAGNGSKKVTWSIAGPTANWVADSGNLFYSGVASGSLLSGFSITGNGLSANVTYPAIRATDIDDNTLTVSITGQQQQRTLIVSRNATNVRWWFKWYYGRSTAETLSSISGLTEQNFANPSSPVERSFAAAPGGGYSYFLVKKPNGSGDRGYTISQVVLKESNSVIPLKNGGTPDTLTITNAQGLSVTYNVYRTLNALEGAYTAQVSYSMASS